MCAKVTELGGRQQWQRQRCRQATNETGNREAKRLEAAVASEGKYEEETRGGSIANGTLRLLGICHVVTGSCGESLSDTQIIQRMLLFTSMSPPSSQGSHLRVTPYLGGPIEFDIRNLFGILRLSHCSKLLPPNLGANYVPVREELSYLRSQEILN